MIPAPHPISLQATGLGSTSVTVRADLHTTCPICGTEHVIPAGQDGFFCEVCQKSFRVEVAVQLVPAS